MRIEETKALHEIGLDLGLEEVEIVRQVLSTYCPDRPVWAFGSRTFGRARRRSDLDLAIGGSERLPRGLIWDIKDALDASDLPIEVDVLDLNDIDPEFRKRIEPDFVPLPVRGSVDAKAIDDEEDSTKNAG
jgi:predicted nucleotidyltransferase